MFHSHILKCITAENNDLSFIQTGWEMKKLGPTKWFDL